MSESDTFDNAKLHLRHADSMPRDQKVNPGLVLLPSGAETSIACPISESQLSAFATQVDNAGDDLQQQVQIYLNLLSQVKSIVGRPECELSGEQFEIVRRELENNSNMVVMIFKFFL